MSEDHKAAAQQPAEPEVSHQLFAGFPESWPLGSLHDSNESALYCTPDMATTWNPRSGKKMSSTSKKHPDEHHKKISTCLHLSDTGSEDDSALTPGGDCDDEDREDYRKLRLAARCLRDVQIIESDRGFEPASEFECDEYRKLNEIVDSDEEVELQEQVRTSIPDESTSFSWSSDFSSFRGMEEQYLRTPGAQFAAPDPTEGFMNIWDREVVEMIVEETNRYAWQTVAMMSETEGGLPKSLEWEETTVDEVYRLFAVLIYMSMVVRPSVKDYWTTGVLGMPEFRQIMPKNRFFGLMRFLHFVDNRTIAPSVRSYERKITKIRPILEHCNRQFSTLYVPNKHLCVDETLLLWKGRVSLANSQTKMGRFGIKSLELCDSNTGYLLRCLLHAGRDAHATNGTVLHLTEGYLDVGHFLVMDNWCNQLPLTRYLKSRRTDVIGTLNRRSLQVPDNIKRVNDDQLRRGEHVASHCGDISVVCWKDGKVVTVMSSCHTDEVVTDRRAGQNIQKPLIVHVHNQHMGGVDSKDQKLSAFLFERKRERKWYIKFFKRLLNTSLLNAYIIYLCDLTDALTHRDFRYSAAEGLLKMFPQIQLHRQRPVALTPLSNRDALRLDNGKHFPTHTDFHASRNTSRHKRLRCVRCIAAGKRSQVITKCDRCNVALCLGECWADYHTLENLHSGRKDVLPICSTLLNAPT